MPVIRSFDIVTSKQSEEQRCVFKDPYGQLSIHQVEKLSSSDPIKKPLISGIKLHSKTIHILNRFLEFITLGFWPRSLRVVLEGKKFYLNLSSYNKWRKANLEALKALGITEKNPQATISLSKENEIIHLDKLLRTNPDQRPKIRPVTKSFEIISSNHSKRQRCVFKDPYGNLLTHQIERWRIEKSASQGSLSAHLITGIKLHSKAQHVLCRILEFMTFGLVAKSLRIELTGKKLYLNLNSYEKWRQLNFEALSALGIKDKPANAPTALVNESEIFHLDKLLRTALIKRPKISPAISTAQNAFEMVEAALNHALFKINSCATPKGTIIGAPKERTQYELAAFYILMNAKIGDYCGKECLRINSQISVRDRRIPKQLEEKLTGADRSTLSPTEQKQCLHTKVVFESTGKNSSVMRLLNTKTDVLSSVWSPNNPIAAKKLLTALAKKSDNFYKKFENELLSPFKDYLVQPLFTDFPEGKALYPFVNGIGHALSDQFNRYSPVPLIHASLKRAFTYFVEQGLVNEENQYTTLAKAITTWATWEILQSATLSEDAYGRINILIQNESDYPLSILYPAEELFEDKDLKTPYFPPHLNALDGQLEEEGHPERALCQKRSALNFVRMKESYDATTLIQFNHLLFQDVKRQTQNPDTVPIKANSDQLANLRTKLEDVADLIYLRYGPSCLSPLIDALEFDHGKVKNLEKFVEPSKPKISRSNEEHEAILKKYLPDTGYPIPFPPKRRAPPRINRQKEDISLLSGNEWVSQLFYKPDSNAGGGNCCVGALAQATFGVYQLGNCVGADCSKDFGLLQKIRQAVGAYMCDHPEKCLDPNEYEPEKLGEKIAELKIRVHHMANMARSDWFDLPEFIAFSHIIGRPIHIISAGRQIRFTKPGEFQLTASINDQYDADPIYLFRAGSHYDHLRPRREGIQPL